MPDLFRVPVRMECGGIDLVHPIDRMPPGAFPYLFNARVLEEGRIDARSGYGPFISLSGNDVPNSIRRLNDPDEAFAPAGYIYVGGGGTNLYAGVESGYTIISGGFSGDPLSLLNFRPDQSPESWMYVYDRAKSAKVSPAGVVRELGVAPPSVSPEMAYSVPAMVTLSDAETTTGWTASGSGGGITQINRAASSVTPTIQFILYDSGTTGWACLNPALASGNFTWAGARMRVVLNSGGGNQERVLVREIHQPIDTTTIAGIQYDSGVNGACTVVLTGNPVGLARNSLVTLGVGAGSQEILRVLSVTVSPDGSSYSFRCFAGHTHTAGETVNGNLSWYVYTTVAHASTEPISLTFVQCSDGTLGVSTGQISLLTSVDASAASGRPVQFANDYFHVSVEIGNPANVVQVRLLVDIDPGTTSLSGAFAKNFYTWTIPGSQLNQADGGWTELLVPLSQGVRTGSDFTLGLANIKAIAIAVDTTGPPLTFGLNCWYVFGTYGPAIQPNSPTGYEFQCRFRDFSTGAHSVPGPQSRYQMFPLREGVILTLPSSSQPGVDEVDIYALGGTLSTFLYLGSVGNGAGTFLDNLPDVFVLDANQPPDLTAFQPWPTLALPWAGTVNVVGTSVEWVSGTKFDPNLLSATVILIGGIAYQTYGQPRSSTFLELFTDGGVQSGVAFAVASPTLAAQPLAFAFGPLEGPFAPVAFALGDPINGGTLYYSNFGDLDSASDQNTLELTGPSEPLVSGATYNGLVFAGSRDNVYLVRYTFLQSPQSFQWAKIPSNSGMWSRWACCRCPIGVAFLGRDGIYIATENGTVNISDAQLYPLFPHDGQPARAVNPGSNVILPVDMGQLDFLRLVYCDQELLFSYLDTGGNSVTMRYEIPKRRWFLHHYNDPIQAHYLIEGSTNSPTSPEILLLDQNSPRIFLGGGNTDNGIAIETLVLTPSYDSGDERAQKLYMDQLMIASGNGTISVAATYDNAQSFGPVGSVVVSGAISQSLQTLTGLGALTLHKNIGAKFAWTGGPAGPALLAWEPSGYLQPFLSTRFVTQIINLSFPGWKHHRRLYAGIISTTPVAFTIQTQDGRLFGPVIIPSSGGVYRVVPLILPQGIKDLAFGYQLDGGDQSFAVFPDSFTIETKEWREDTYIELAVLKT